MPEPQNKNEINRAQRRRVRILLNLSGFIFFFLAGFIASSPDKVESLLGMDKDTQHILAIAFAVMACGDFLIARFMFGKKDTL